MDIAEQHHPDAAAGARNSMRAEPVYVRPMPGGGYVRVELLVSQPGNVAAERLRGRVVLERRLPAPATPDEDPVVVEEVEGPDENMVVAELLRIASDNAAIARRVLRRQSTTAPRAD
jgi:hypothetical protein